MPPTTTSAVWRRSTSGSSARARATCRCAPRNPSATSSPISPARLDLVLIDAPCTGTGAWRRNPDAKWRMRPGALEQRQKEQARDPRPRGAAAQGRRPHRLCHLLGARRGKRRAGARFLARHPEFSIGRRPRSPRRLGERAFMFAKAARLSDEGLLMTPRTTETDGFFVALLSARQGPCKREFHRLRRIPRPKFSAIFRE